MNWLAVFATVRDAILGGLLVYLWYAYQAYRAECGFWEANKRPSNSIGIERARMATVRDMRRWRVSAGLEESPLDTGEWLDLYRDAPGEPRIRGSATTYYLCAGQGEAAYGETPGEAFRSWLRDVKDSLTAS